MQALFTKNDKGLTALMHSCKLLFSFMPCLWKKISFVVVQAIGKSADLFLEEGVTHAAFDLQVNLNGYVLFGCIDEVSQWYSTERCSV